MAVGKGLKGPKGPKYQGVVWDRGVDKLINDDARFKNAKLGLQKLKKGPKVLKIMDR